ncbi:hypothetical protein C7S18_13755 [Ahniella affigens]|uniref:Glutathione synthetase n=1 Tax=Ahniella affigens TaxID=2021234 RepID=A0A2P1PTN4_9GAMM|nr:SemiSWEET transporter [Ahniella affigens]AVP98191.1 hypothetical protein C7S18_13755 [Ahniella affigens]
MDAELVGYLAAVLTTSSFLPQALKTLRTRDVSGISLSMYCLFVSGVLLWLVYGVMRQAWPIIIANAITAVLAGSVLVLKLRHR